MTAGDWISLAGLVISVIGFSVVIRQSARTANAPETRRLTTQARPAAQEVVRAAAERGVV